MRKPYLPFICLNLPSVGTGSFPVYPIVWRNLPLVCNRRNAAGFSIVELMVTVLVLAILSALAYPSFQGLLLNTKIRAVTGDITAVLHLARSEAVKQKQASVVCVSSDGASCTGGTDWAAGMLVWSDRNSNSAIDAGEILRVVPAAPNRITVTFTPSGTTSLQFGSMGTSNVPGSYQVCDSTRNGEPGKEIQITATGRPSVIELTCS